MKNNLCGSGMAHSICNVAGKIDDLKHYCAGSSTDYHNCPYADKGGHYTSIEEAERNYFDRHGVPMPQGKYIPPLCF